MVFRKSNLKKLGFATASLAALSITFAACGPSEELVEPQTGGIAPGEDPALRQAPTTDTLYNVADYYGQPITVSGEITEQVSESAVVIEAQDQFEGQEILVIVPAGTSLPNEENALIQVTGELEAFRSDDAERYNLDSAEDVAVYEGRPVLVAESVNLEGENLEGEESDS